MKEKRIVNKDLLDKRRGLPCIICAKPGISHHVRSQGAGGDDVDANLMQLCQWHHIEVHSRGLNEFSHKYDPVKQWLKDNNWKYDDFNEKFIRVSDKGWED